MRYLINGLLSVKTSVGGNLIIDPQTVYLDAQAQSRNTLVTSSGPWSHDSDDVPVWVSVLTGYGENGYYFDASVLANMDIDRECYITIWLDSNHLISQDFHIFQAGLI